MGKKAQSSGAPLLEIIPRELISADIMLSCETTMVWLPLGRDIMYLTGNTLTASDSGEGSLVKKRIPRLFTPRWRATFPNCALRGPGLGDGKTCGKGGTSSAIISMM